MFTSDEFKSQCKHCGSWYPTIWKGYPRFYGDFCSKACGEKHEKETARASIKQELPTG